LIEERRKIRDVYFADINILFIFFEESFEIFKFLVLPDFLDK